MEIRRSTWLSSQLEREGLEDARPKKVHGNLHCQKGKGPPFELLDIENSRKGCVITGTKLADGKRGVTHDCHT